MPKNTSKTSTVTEIIVNDGVLSTNEAATSNTVATQVKSDENAKPYMLFEVC